MLDSILPPSFLPAPACPRTLGVLGLYFNMGEVPARAEGAAIICRKAVLVVQLAIHFFGEPVHART